MIIRYCNRFQAGINASGGDAYLEIQVVQPGMQGPVERILRVAMTEQVLVQLHDILGKLIQGATDFRAGKQDAFIQFAVGKALEAKPGERS